MLKEVISKKVQEEAYPRDQELLFSNVPFQESLRWHRELKLFILNLYEEVLFEIDEIILLINEELGDSD